MRNLISATVIAGILISCSFNRGVDLENLNENFDPEHYPQKWKLIEMSGNIANLSPSTGSDMAWQEYYLLHSDSTFTKSRKQDETVTEESGTYAFVVLPDGEYLELSYESDNNLIGNCTSETKELLKVNSGNKMIGTWWACDGPGLVYTRVK